MHILLSPNKKIYRVPIIGLRNGKYVGLLSNKSQQYYQNLLEVERVDHAWKKKKIRVILKFVTLKKCPIY